MIRLVVIVILVLVGAGSIWALYLVALSIGVAETIYDTSAQSIVPQMVHRDQLARANGRLYAAELAANEFIGPPLAGFLAAAGAVFAFAAPAALWAVASAKRTSARLASAKRTSAKPASVRWPPLRPRRSRVVPSCQLGAPG